MKRMVRSRKQPWATSPDETVPEPPDLGKRGARLSLQRLSKSFGSVSALEDVSLDIASGEFVALLGPSGAGKTTALRLIAGFQHPDDGEILVDGEPITWEPPHRRNIGLVFQHYALFPHMNVEKNVRFPLRTRKVPKAEADQRVRDALSLVRLDGYGHRLPNELSGGQQQRVALARAIVFNPDILLMDEPLAALDKKLREELRVELKRIQDELGATVVYVTHDQDEALAMADRIAVINSGRVEQVGTPDDIYHQPRTYFVADFIGQGNFFEACILDIDDTTVRATDVSHSLQLVAEQSPGANTPRVGDRAVYLVRPERIHLEPVSSMANVLSTRVNAIAVTIVESFFLGSRTTHILRSRDGHELVSSSPAGSPESILHKGQHCLAHWQPSSGLLLPHSVSLQVASGDGDHPEPGLDTKPNSTKPKEKTG